MTRDARRSTVLSTEHDTDTSTRNLLLSLTADFRTVRTTRNGKASGADVRDIGELVNLGLIERHYTSETTKRGTFVQYTNCALSVAGARYVANLNAR